MNRSFTIGRTALLLVLVGADAFAAPSNKGRYRYPGAAPFAGRTVAWNRQRIADYLATVGAWQAKNQVAPNRIAGAEFGCFRRNPGCGDYLADVHGGPLVNVDVSIFTAAHGDTQRISALMKQACISVTVAA